MFDSAILDTVIGVVFLLVLFSTVCAAVRESIESILKTRASYLEYGIRELLNDMSDKGLVRELYTHPLVSGLFADQYKPAAARSRTVCDWKRRNLPSYIPAKNFAAALIDIAMRGKRVKPVPAILARRLTHRQAPRQAKSNSKKSGRVFPGSRTRMSKGWY